MGFFMEILNREITRQAGLFAFIGITSTVLNYLVFLLLLSYFNQNYLMSASIGFISGVLFGYGFNRILTFQSNKKIEVTLPKYFMVYFFSLFVNLTFLYLLVNYININPVWANLILAPFIIIINFFGTKLIAFENRKW